MKILWAFHLSLFLALQFPASAETPSPQEYAANWPCFRGPAGGVSPQTGLPVTCDPKTGANIAWTADVPAAGFGSPVIWSGRVFISGGDARQNVMMAFDAATGKLLWQKPVPATGAAGEAAEVPDQCGMAAGTPATDGQRVYAMYANGDVAAFTLDGAVAWARRLAVPKNPYGHASSLLTWRDRLIVQFDQGEAGDNLSKLYALDGATGAVLWETPRPVGASWATPILIDLAGNPQIVTAAAPWVIAYAPQTGEEIWRADCLDGEVTPSPIFAGGTVFAVSPTVKLQTIRPDGKGDVTTSHLGWVAEDGIPDIASPVSDGELVYLLDSSGTLSCYDAKTGLKQWQQDLGGEFNASPAIAGHRLYLLSKKGTMIVAATGRACKELGRSELGGEVLASPAFAPNQMLVRTSRRLICISPR